jgi:hypothetical protein
MKILRSVMRRGFSVGTAGYFTVLKPNTWFAASRLSDSFRYPSDRSKGVAAAQQTTLVHADSGTTTMPSLLVRWAPQEPRLVRIVLIALAAIAITSALLWWIMGAPTILLPHH